MVETQLKINKLRFEIVCPIRTNAYILLFQSLYRLKITKERNSYSISVHIYICPNSIDLDFRVTNTIVNITIKLQMLYSKDVKHGRYLKTVKNRNSSRPVLLLGHRLYQQAFCKNSVK